MENEETHLEETALMWMGRTRGLMITDQASYDRVAAMAVELANLIRNIKAYHAKIKQATHQAHKEACAMEERALSPAEQAQAIVHAEIGRWEKEQERLRLEAQREAEQWQRHLDEEARQALAEEAKQSGATEETVAEILDTPVVVIAPFMGPTFQRAEGIATQRRWRAEVYDLKALCRAVADGRVSPELVQANMPALNSMARAMKQTLNIPGVRAVPETTVTVVRK